MSRNKILLTTFLTVFLLIFLIAVVARISLRVSATRALLAAVIISALLWLAMRLFQYFAPPEPTTDQSEHLGRNINIEVTDGFEELSDQDFVPLAGQQVDPNMAKVINQDPEKLAKIVEKMGFNE